MTEQERRPSEASELEGGGAEQTRGQGEGRHEPTIPDEDDEDEQRVPPTYSDGNATKLDDPELPLTREEEGMDR